MKQFLLNLLKESGHLLQKHYKLDKKISSKGMAGIVTDIDFKSEKIIVDLITKKFPDHSILTEETLSKKTNSKYLWLIDPIDGTTNFSQQYPLFCISIALAKNNVLTHGAVYAPILDSIYYAEKGKGAFVNGKKISVSDKTKLKDSVLATGFAYDRGDIMWNNLKNIGNILEGRKTHGIRINGSAAMDLCYVACGKHDGFWEFNLKPWDLAAGALMVQEAGGSVTGLKGEKWQIFSPKILATNGNIHDQILKIVK